MSEHVNTQGFIPYFYLTIESQLKSVLAGLIGHLNAKAFKVYFLSFHAVDSILCTDNCDYFIHFCALLQAVAGPPGSKGEKVCRCRH